MANSIATLKMEMAGLSKQASSKLRMLKVTPDPRQPSRTIRL